MKALDPTNKKDLRDVSLWLHKRDKKARLPDRTREAMTSDEYKKKIIAEKKGVYAFTRDERGKVDCVRFLDTDSLKMTYLESGCKTIRGKVFNTAAFGIKSKLSSLEQGN